MSPTPQNEVCLVLAGGLSFSSLQLRSATPQLGSQDTHQIKALELSLFLLHSLQRKVGRPMGKCVDTARGKQVQS